MISDFYKLLENCSKMKINAEKLEYYVQNVIIAVLLIYR